MLSFPANTRLFLATAPTDLRKSFTALSALVDGTFGMNAMSGDLYCVFRADLGTDSGNIWAPIPETPGHRFRSTWAPISEHLGTAERVTRAARSSP